MDFLSKCQAFLEKCRPILASLASMPTSFIWYFVLMIGAISMMGVALRTGYWFKMELWAGPITFKLNGLCEGDDCDPYSDRISIGLRPPTITPRPTYNSLQPSEEYPFKDVSPNAPEMVRSLCIASLIFNVFTFVFMIHLVCGKKTKVNSIKHGTNSMTFAICAAILAWLAVILYTDEPTYIVNDQIEWTYGYGMYLAAASGAVGLIAGLTMVAGVGQLYKEQHQQRIDLQPGLKQGEPWIQVVGVPVEYGYPVGAPKGMPSKALPST